MSEQTRGSSRGRVNGLGDLARKNRRYLVGFAAAGALYALLGFFLAPWLVKNSAINAVRENLGAELRIGKVAINPFVLSLRIDGLELDDPAGARFVRVDEIFVNFQTSSLFRWAWTFDEISLTAPQLNLSRDSAGTLNLAAFKMPTPARFDVSSPSCSPLTMLSSLCWRTSALRMLGLPYSRSTRPWMPASSPARHRR